MVIEWVPELNEIRMEILEGPRDMRGRGGWYPAMGTGSPVEPFGRGRLPNMGRMGRASPEDPLIKVPGGDRALKRTILFTDPFTAKMRGEDIAESDGCGAFVVCHGLRALCGCYVSRCITFDCWVGKERGSRARGPTRGLRPSAGRLDWMGRSSPRFA